MKKFSLFVFFAVLIMLVGCSKQEAAGSASKEFNSKEHGFSFDYVSGWEAVESDLPDKWAIKDANDNTILFVVSKSEQKDLMALGLSQALSDAYPETSPQDISDKELSSVKEMVKLQTFNEQQWFTYGVNFAKLNAKSLISGTVCGENEVLLVLVTDPISEESAKTVYNSILNSFKC